MISPQKGTYSVSNKDHIVNTKTRVLGKQAHVDSVILVSRNPVMSADDCGNPKSVVEVVGFDSVFEPWMNRNLYKGGIATVCAKECARHSG